MKVMIIEDDKTLANEMKRYCEKWGLQVLVVQRFDAIVQEVESVSPQLILLDINLPFYDGFYWCDAIRKISTVPILFISSRDSNQDKIMAITTGGDDYIQKPFALEYLMAKINALLRRTYEYQKHVILHLREDVLYDAQKGLLIYQDAMMELTRMEHKIIDTLVKNKGRIVTREELMMELWSTDAYISDGSLTTGISRLKAKIKSFCAYEDIIVTRKGQGYLIV